MASAPSVSRTVAALTGRLFWLPPAGIGTVVDSEGWAPILETDRRTALGLVGTLGTDGIPAFTAPIFPVRELTRHPGPWRIWVSTAQYSAAESALMRAEEAGSAFPPSTASGRARGEAG